MRRTKQTVTIQDVAKTAGVSVSTVSRVLNGKADVAMETQDRIRSVIDDLGYTGWVGCEYRPRGDTVAGLGWGRAYGLGVA